MTRMAGKAYGGMTGKTRMSGIRHTTKVAG